MTEDIQPASLPEPIDNHPYAIWVYWTAVGAIAAGFLLIVAGSLVLTGLGAPVPDILSSLGMAALVALAGMLANKRQ